MDLLFYTAGQSQALSYAVNLLRERGVPFSGQTDLAVTHLLLPTPAFTADGCLQGGSRLESLLPQLSSSVAVIGGKLEHPLLDQYQRFDLLDDDTYVTENALITAHCALKYAMEKLPVILDGCPVLVIGWGRIGKCLCKLLQGLGANVTVAARKAKDRAMARALGCASVPTAGLTPKGYRLIFNSVPEMLLPDAGSAVKIELASSPGIGGKDIIVARGLPGKDAPESTGRLIAETVSRHCGLNIDF